MRRATLSLLGSALSAALLCASNSPAPGAPAAQAQAAQQSWTGTLVDAGCKNSSPASACEVSSNTSAFGIVTNDGKFYKFDAAGNSKAKAMSGQDATKRQVTVTGKLEGDTIHVQDVKAS